MENLFNFKIETSYMAKKELRERQNNPDRWGKEGRTTAAMFREIRNSDDQGLVIKGPWKENKKTRKKKVTLAQLFDPKKDYGYWKDRARKSGIQLSFQDISDFGAIDGIGIHCCPDDLSELDGYIEGASRDGFDTIYAYVS